MLLIRFASRFLAQVDTDSGTSTLQIGLQRKQQLGFESIHLLLVLWIVVTVSPTMLVSAQSLEATNPPMLALPTQRLRMEQIEELALSGEYAEAVSGVEKLFDEGQGKVVKNGIVQTAGTLRVQPYVPLRTWCKKQLSRSLLADPSEKSRYQTRLGGTAQSALDEVQRSKDLEFARQAADRFFATELGPQLSLVLADLYLEHGWSIAAVQAAQSVSEDLRATLFRRDGDIKNSDAVGAVTAGSLPWQLLWRETLNSDEDLATFSQLLSKTAASGRSRQELLGSALERVLLAALVDPDQLDRDSLSRWVRAVLPALSEEKQSRLLGILDADWQQAARDPKSTWTTFGGSNSRSSSATDRFSSQRWPKWSQTLERYYALSDRTPASEPRVAEMPRGTLPYHPVVVDGKVYLNTMTTVVAYDLETGRPWPDISPSLPLFDSGISPAAFIPLGYPLVGTPRGTLSHAGGMLYARMGEPVSGWANGKVAADGGSQSYIAAMDMSRQGSQLRGFPLRLFEPEFSGAEFEGAPLVWGDWLIVAIVERDNVGLRRSVAAFDRFSGEKIWRSPVLVTGAVEGSERANLITHQLLSSAGGRVYYNTNLGAVVCLDPLTGRVEWLTQYARSTRQGQAYPKPDRFRFRDLTPCLISQGLVYCCPQDCPEIFALDATTGDLVWSTDNDQVADATQLLSVEDEALLVSGDRLVWLDRLTGRVLARYPGSTTPGNLNALPSPRGLGRGVISAGEVYWPTSGEILVFPASLDGLKANATTKTVSPPIRRRLELDSRGKEGGNIVISGGWLLFTSPSRIVAFPAEKNPVEKSLSSLPRVGRSSAAPR